MESNWNYKEPLHNVCKNSISLEENAESSFEKHIPPEVWEHIFRGLSPQDFLKVINTRQQWREILKPQTTRALLPLVLPILLENANVPDSQLLQTFLPWRTLSHGAKQSVDKILEADSTSPKTHYEYVTGISKSKSLWLKQSQTRRLTYFASKRYSFKNAEDILNFLIHFGEYSKKGDKDNKFLSKSISFEIQTRLPALLNPDFVSERRLWMLTQYGQQLASLTCNIVGGLTFDYLLHFLELLQHVPNLKILKVGGDLVVEGRGREPNLPDLKHLELLNLEESCGEKSILPPDGDIALGPLLVEHYGPQLKTLICRAGLLEKIGANVVNSYLPNLKCLRVGPVRRSLLLQLTELEFPLEEVQFCRYAATDGTLKLTDFIRGVDQFACTLSHLKIMVDLPDYEFTDVEQEAGNGKLVKLLNLKTLSTTRFNFYTRWFRTVIPSTCPNLEELNIDRAKQETELSVMKGAFQLIQSLKKVVISYCGNERGRPVKMVMMNDLTT
ncbi:unnamed protein product [Orchesella dallaii]|uniref:F-box domain-containing protein n=1 Tax=Orchesella dallaii TaxID=48710 RepID=A0ABP1S859_9HEXA